MTHTHTHTNATSAIFKSGIERNDNEKHAYALHVLYTIYVFDECVNFVFICIMLHGFWWRFPTKQNQNNELSYRI